MSDVVHYHSGWDYFTPNEGTKDFMRCLACQSLMDKEENVEVCNSKYAFRDIRQNIRAVDKFTCPNSGKKWHDQVIALRKLQRDTPSNKLYDIYDEEIEEIKHSKMPTKESWM